ncbi:MAG: hypothetical protein KF862_25190 [Chitinophagaceae bacterium]|nr:hypothetical protein [Chitinophagaceae bacterium]
MSNLFLLLQEKYFLPANFSKMFRFCFIFLLLCCAGGYAQSDSTHHRDTVKAVLLEEVIIVGDRPLRNKTNKPLANLEQYLEKANAVNMIRRGGYAWEPLINGMATERSVITIDGMRIYGACTDKMDPVTSYVEITNLEKANVHSGQAGSAGGATIAGSLDLVRKKNTFGAKSLKGIAFAGFELNNRQKILGTGINWQSPKTYSSIDLTFRDADNYKAGGGEEVLYSQFTKYNMSAIAGFKIDEHQHIEASLIYDHAVDIGYPALPMDVSLARAYIGSVEYVRHHISSSVHQWQTKLYFNDVTHVMDDSKRPVVPIRMDMPGWSKTAGFYSRVEGTTGGNNWKLNISGHHNYSLAEMTMFSNTPDEKDMFMLTWPGVQTNYGDLYGEASLPVGHNLKAVLSAGLALHNNLISKESGLESLKIFYPDMSRSKTRLLKRFSATMQYNKNHWLLDAGIAYGDRAPSVSEGYGFYLFNSFDRFDYIGNPGMKNEKSVSVNGAAAFENKAFMAKLSGSFFYLTDYIIGMPDNGLSVMTIGASGVKVYGQLKSAAIFNTSLDVNYQLTEKWYWTNKLGYRRGTGYGIGNLPLIQPFTYASAINFKVKAFSAELSMNGAARHNKYNSDFGERALPAYTVFNVMASQRVRLAKTSLQIKAGVENILDNNYTTFSDWNRVPRMGRNLFINLVVVF